MSIRTCGVPIGKEVRHPEQSEGSKAAPKMPHDDRQIVRLCEY